MGKRQNNGQRRRRSGVYPPIDRYFMLQDSIAMYVDSGANFDDNFTELEYFKNMAIKALESSHVNFVNQIMNRTKGLTQLNSEISHQPERKVFQVDIPKDKAEAIIKTFFREHNLEKADKRLDEIITEEK